jgi:hypothetical protein
MCSFEATGQGVYPQETSFRGGVTLRSNGYGLFAERVSQKKDKPWSTSIQVNALTHKHAKEVKIRNPKIPRSSGFVYGKLNRVGLVQGGYGLEYALVQKEMNRGVTMSLGSSGSIGLGVLRPVYLEFAYMNSAGTGINYVQEQYDPEKHSNRESIVGYAGETRSWSQLEYRLNLSLKTYVNVEWGNHGVAEKGLRFGVMQDFFPNGLEIMALTTNPTYYATGFVSVYWRFKNK